VGKRSIATIGREKLQNIYLNKKPLLQVDSSKTKVSGMHKFIRRCYNKSLQIYLATADVEIRDFRKIRFSPVKIKVIQWIAIHPAISAKDWIL
jgi:hypothetical protein